MLIECSKCASVYNVTAEMIGANGRKFRCASCREVWHVDMQEDVAPQDSDDPCARLELGLAEAIPADADTHIRVEAASERAQPPAYDEIYTDNRRAPPPDAPVHAPSKWKWPKPGLTAALVLIGTGMGIVSARASIVRMEPMTAALFAALNLPVNPLGLDLHDVASSVQKVGDQQVLAISGTIINVSRHAQHVPHLQITVRDKDGHALYTWMAKPVKTDLIRGEELAFHARLAAPPAGARDVAVHFAAQQLAMRNNVE
ncbi:MAG: zinc-ribbon domain-containing protein [Hyphomicrobiales bacterium]|nr:zinc-ribbon domain-containing protein [Hyphomicrobiales bacterium]MDE2113466.1 zinc-ribbon domain-containing protein [Hyphomicrobiales bacterium]